MARKPRVLNKKTDGVPAGAVYCGRPHREGNDFVMKGEVDRDRVVALDKAQLREQLRTIPAREAQIEALRGRDIVCWCAPRACHLDIRLLLANTTPALRRAWICDEPGAEAEMAREFAGGGPAAARRAPDQSAMEI